MSTTTPGADQLQALISYSNNKTGVSDTTLSDAVTRLVNGYGGGAIEDGIVIKARDQQGHITEIDYYKSDGIINPFEFANGRANSQVWAWGYLTKINLKGALGFTIGNSAFSGCWNLVELNWDKIVSIPNNGSTNNGPTQTFQNCRNLTSVNAPNLEGSLPTYCFYNCYALTTVFLPKITALHGYANNRGCLQTNQSENLTTVEVGSISYPVTFVHEYAFNTAMAGTITIYTNASNIDTILSTLRNNCASATIIIKASEALTYNGTSYAAGDVVITSTPSTT